MKLLMRKLDNRNQNKVIEENTVVTLMNMNQVK